MKMYLIRGAFIFLMSVRGITFYDELRLITAVLVFTYHILRRLLKPESRVYDLSYYIPGKDPVLVRYRDKEYDVKFIIRPPRSGDFYDVLVEHYELSHWLALVLNTTKHAVIVDVGAYIGGYTVRACKKAGR